ncbi:hypothetical protein OM076_44395 [Solirubrobacter ginsenosidimutans]|uniref:Uncharacterized protein n=1 Tax=Solirubrobacter ginsenosidimutans TaxID=490573 RepID=A0A9X3N353_9ACTN|nr:hypothetical protein [Solirubrobacter ginsenosidimutans]MDA0167382.1 hypothetical protein [Solirubrobacter ginsenosidimutans]
MIDALFVTRGPSNHGMDAVALASGTFASMLDFRLDAGGRRAITGGAPTVFDEAVARAQGRLIANDPTDPGPSRTPPRCC